MNTPVSQIPVSKMDTKPTSRSMCKADSFEDLFRRSVTCLDTMTDDEKQVSRSVKQQDTDVYINMEENSAEVEDVTEEEIESNFTSYRPYIESCIKLLDLIVFVNLFTPGIS